MLVHRKVTPSCRYPFIHLGGERHCETVRCLAQEQNTVSPAKDQTRTARSSQHAFSQLVLKQEKMKCKRDIPHIVLICPYSQGNSLKLFLVQTRSLDRNSTCLFTFPMWEDYCLGTRSPLGSPGSIQDVFKSFQFLWLKNRNWKLSYQLAFISLILKTKYRKSTVFALANFELWDFLFWRILKKMN